jgi:hypothetical protein
MLSCGRPALLFLAYVFLKPNGLQLVSCWPRKVPEMPIGSHLAPNELSRRTPPHLIHLLRASHILAASQTISSDGCRSFPIIRRHNKTAICIHTNRFLQTMMLSDGAAVPLTTIRVQIGSAPTVASNWIGTNRRFSPVRMMIGGSVVELSATFNNQPQILVYVEQGVEHCQGAEAGSSIG